jgi:hypothetical protein
VKVTAPRENAARVAGSSWSASATRRYSRASRLVTPKRQARKPAKSSLSASSRSCHASSIHRAVAAATCAESVASSSIRRFCCRQCSSAALVCIGTTVVSIANKA